MVLFVIAIVLALIINIILCFFALIFLSKPQMSKEEFRIVINGPGRKRHGRGIKIEGVKRRANWQEMTCAKICRFWYYKCNVFETRNSLMFELISLFWFFAWPILILIHLFIIRKMEAYVISSRKIIPRENFLLCGN